MMLHYSWLMEREGKVVYFTAIIFSLTHIHIYICCYLKGKIILNWVVHFEGEKLFFSSINDNTRTDILEIHIFSMISITTTLPRCIYYKDGEQFFHYQNCVSFLHDLAWIVWKYFFECTSQEDTGNVVKLCESYIFMLQLHFPSLFFGKRRKKNSYMNILKAFVQLVCVSSFWIFISLIMFRNANERKEKEGELDGIVSI